jgi:hypothetical protein
MGSCNTGCIDCPVACYHVSLLHLSAGAAWACSPSVLHPYVLYAVHTSTLEESVGIAHCAIFGQQGVSAKRYCCRCFQAYSNEATQATEKPQSLILCYSLRLYSMYCGVASRQTYSWGRVQGRLDIGHIQHRAQGRHRRSRSLLKEVLRWELPTLAALAERSRQDGRHPRVSPCLPCHRV